MATITSFSSIVKSGRKSAPKKSMTKIMPDFGETIDPYVEQAVRTLYDSVYELERRALALEDSGFLTQRVAEKKFGAVTTKKQLQVKAPKIVLNVDNLIGVLAQPQKTAVREVTALPPATSSYDGELVLFGGLIYRFSGVGVGGGEWRVISTAAPVFVDTHVNRVANFDPADFEVGVLFWESDREVLYRRDLNGSLVAGWVYTLGKMPGTVIASDVRPVDLGTDAEDDTFLFYATDLGITYQWDGTSAWDYYEGVARIEQTITADTEIADPTKLPVGVTVDYLILQDGTGGWAVTWASVFKGVSPLTVGRTANFISAVRFYKRSATQLVIQSNQGDIEI